MTSRKPATDTILAAPAPQPPVNHHGYVWIVAWARLMFLDAATIQWECDLAREQRAPADAVYPHPTGWRRVADLSQVLRRRLGALVDEKTPTPAP